jgi:hypothetical protein
VGDGASYRVNDDGTTTPVDGPPGFAYSRSRVPDEAYGRVTNSERSRVLHTAARELLDRLTAAYAVDRDDGDAALDPALTGRFTASVDTVVRLTPRSPDAAPLTVAFTGFPGLGLRFGQWTTEPLPSCGCDACDEDPTELIALFTSNVKALVAGDFTEQIAPGDDGESQVEYRLGSQHVVSGAGTVRRDPPIVRRWRPWLPVTT